MTLSGATVNVRMSQGKSLTQWRNPSWARNFVTNKSGGAGENVSLSVGKGKDVGAGLVRVKTNDIGGEQGVLGVWYKMQVALYILCSIVYFVFQARLDRFRLRLSNLASLSDWNGRYISVKIGYITRVPGYRKLNSIADSTATDVAVKPSGRRGGGKILNPRDGKSHQHVVLQPPSEISEKLCRSTSGVATRTDQAPPTLHGVTATEQAILRKVRALLGADITAPAVQGEAEELVRENIADLLNISRDTRTVIALLKEAIAKHRETTAILEVVLVALEDIQGN
ncbi:hypothetical protein GYMLUDRAFT_990388 [Collybiopsis luxurians FD-317 M1]|uniref:Uncharacterized protein n=1 Tax=Collybiopsis luxurians FD-317 M1 TaxID=944289 RepID=A0A0D0D195_9AGAR|nr:hypothetical protein GYMLUDRAFT_990388 [Collybiopsis luxurians FD-317 M1]